MDVLIWYLQGLVGIVIQGGEVQNDAKLCFSSTEASRSSRSCYVGRRTGICIPTDGELMTLSFLFFNITNDTYDIYDTYDTNDI